MARAFPPERMLVILAKTFAHVLRLEKLRGRVHVDLVAHEQQEARVRTFGRVELLPDRFEDTVCGVLLEDSAGPAARAHEERKLVMAAQGLHELRRNRDVDA